MNTIDLNLITAEAAELAREWQDSANGQMTPAERKVQKRIARLLTHPTDKVLLTMMFDQSFRTQDTARVADQVNELLRQYGIPQFMTAPERGLFRLFRHISGHLHSIVVPLMIERIRKDSRRTVIPGEENLLLPHLAKRKIEGVRMNINHIGEAVHGEEEACRRLQGYLADLENPAIEQISIKISTIYSQIQSIAFDHTVEELVKRLTRVYRTARDNDSRKPTERPNPNSSTSTWRNTATSTSLSPPSRKRSVSTS